MRQKREGQCAPQASSACSAGARYVYHNSVNSHGVLQNTSKARIMPGCLTNGSAAAVMIQHAGQARRELWLCLVPQDRGPEDLPASSARGIMPPDFDWHTYLLYHPELRTLGVDTDKLAREHYMQQGRAEVLILSCFGLPCVGPGKFVSTQPATQLPVRTCSNTASFSARLSCPFSLSASGIHAASSYSMHSSEAREVAV